MAAFLRSASSALIAALGTGVELAKADLFEFDLVDGVTRLYFTSWPFDLVVGGITYLSKNPWINGGKWNVVNTMQVPSMQVILRALNNNFAGGSQIKTQIHNGLFSGASFILSRAYMTLTDAQIGNTSTLGVLDLFGGVVGGIDLSGTTATITCKGKNNRLNQYGPRATLQQACNHTFCDAGCTGNRASFTKSFVVGAGPTSLFVPWTVPPANPVAFTSGTMTLTSGVGDAQQREIVGANSSGVTLIYPLFEIPNPGDSFAAFQGCDKTFNSGSGQSCTDYALTPNYDGFEFTPPPTASV